MRAFLNPTMEELRHKLDGELAQHIPDAGARNQAVNWNASVHALRNIMSCFWHVFQATERPVETARQVLSEIDSILAGEKPWLKP